jgi:hypothetical protein
MTGTRLRIVGLAGTLLTSVIWTTPTMAGGAARSAGALTMEAILAAKDRIVPLFTKMGAPKPGDWLESHQESGQTFDEYVRSGPRTQLSRIGTGVRPDHRRGGTAGPASRGSPRDTGQPHGGLESRPVVAHRNRWLSYPGVTHIGLLSTRSRGGAPTSAS